MGGNAPVTLALFSVAMSVAHGSVCGPNSRSSVRTSFMLYTLIGAGMGTTGIGGGSVNIGGRFGCGGGGIATTGTIGTVGTSSALGATTGLVPTSVATIVGTSGPSIY